MILAIAVMREDREGDPPDIYFEAGDHQALVHMRSSEFLRLMAKVSRGRISYHM